MYKLNKILTVLITLFVLSDFCAQIIVFKTMSDYQNKTGELYDEFTWKQSNSRMTLILTKNGVKFKIKCNDIWGFAYKDALFRIYSENNNSVPARVIADGKLIHYENGNAHLMMLENNSESGYYSAYDGYGAYVSKNLDSKMIPIGESNIISHRVKVNKSVKEFTDEFPEYNDFFNCLTDYRLETVRQCRVVFEESN